MSIEFIQYLLPNGRRRRDWIDLDPETEAKAHEIEDAGFRFEMEMLSDYSTVSFTITDEDADHAIKLCTNGPQVPRVIKELIMEFNLEAYKRNK